MFKRDLTLPRSGTATFFLWGPRQTGKTTLLLGTYPDAFWVDLLKADEFRRYLQNALQLVQRVQRIERMKSEMKHDKSSVTLTVHPPRGLRSFVIAPVLP